MVGLSVVSQTLCKIVVFPEFALPMMRTRNAMFGIGRNCFVSIAFVSIGERQSQESGIDLKRLGSHAYQAERYRCDLPLESSHVINQMILALERSVII